jgi:hypothetical protein
MARSRNLRELLQHADSKRVNAPSTARIEPAKADSPFAVLATLKFSQVAVQAATKVASTPVAPVVVAKPAPVAPVVVVEESAPRHKGRKVHYVPMSAAVVELSWEQKLECGRVSVAEGPLLNWDLQIKDRGQRFCNGRAIAHLDSSEKVVGWSNAADNFASRVTDLNDESVADTRDIFVNADFDVIYGEDEDYCITRLDEEVEHDEDGDEIDPEDRDESMKPDHRRDYRFYGARRELKATRKKYGGSGQGIYSWMSDSAKAELRAADKKRRALNEREHKRPVRQQFSHGRKGREIHVTSTRSKQPQAKPQRHSHNGQKLNGHSMNGQKPQGHKPRAQKYGGVTAPQYGKTDTLAAMQAAMGRVS